MRGTSQVFIATGSGAAVLACTAATAMEATRHDGGSK